MGAGGIAFAVYLETLAPALVSIVDTPKFQFIGKVLGVAHNPGYPLYVVLSHFFGYLPIGSLAYRINLLSAVCAATAVGLTALIALRSDIRPLVAFTVAVALALGAVFWQTAVIAEVYTLHAVFVASMTLALFTWGQRGAPRHFYLGVACFALALGHHTTIVLLALPYALYALVMSPRFALRARTIAASVLIVAVGIAQYAFIIIRTRQGAYTESPAANLEQLVGVVRGQQFAHHVMVPGLSVLTERLSYIAGWFHSELTFAGLVLAGIGAVAWWRRDRAGTLYLISGAASVAAFGVVYTVMDVHLFLIPAFVLLWILAARGADSLLSRLSGSKTATTLAGAALIALPVVQYARNIGENDLSHRWEESRYMHALLSYLPEHSALLREDFLVDRMVLYEVLGEDTLRGRDVLAPISPEFDHIASLHARGVRVFAFTKSAAALRRQGADFSYAPVRVPYGSLRRYIEDLPDGTPVAVAIPAVHLPALLTADPALSLIGASLPGAGLDRVNIAVAGKRGTRRSMVDQPIRGPAIVRTTIGQTAVEIEARDDLAAIRVSRREVIRSSRGAVVAVWHKNGTLRHAFATSPDGQVIAPMSPLATFELRAVRSWTPLRDELANVGGFTRTGNLMVRLTGSRCTAEFLLGAERPLAPFLVDSANRRDGILSIEQLDPHRIVMDLRVRHTRYVYRIRVESPNDVVQLALGGIPAVAFARAAAGQVELLGIDLATHLEAIDDETRGLHMGRDHHATLVGSGWSPVEADGVGGFRRTLSAEAELLLPGGTSSTVSHVSLQMRSPSSGHSITLVLNGHNLGRRLLDDGGWSRYDWSIPADILREPANSMVLQGTPGIDLADVLIVGAPSTPVR